MRATSGRAIAMAAAAVLASCGRGTEPGGPARATGRAAAGDAGGGVRAAAAIDSHVHLAYWPVADRLAAAGIAAAVDLGEPIDAIAARLPLTVNHAGPMLTRPGGYPIDAWDPGGFGRGCGDVACVRDAIAAAAGRGARVVKVVAGDDGLAPDLMRAAVAAAHARGMKVAAHALGDADARVAADAGCDLLAHTPVAPLTDATVAAWRGRAVISTLAAFGGHAETVDNLRRLRAAGATVLYGTDLGNTRVAGIDGDELRLLAAAGLDPAAIVAAMTTAPAAYWGITLPADTYLILPRDPAVDPTAYTEPSAVWLAGKQLR